MMEGSGSGSVLVTNGSGFRRPKNLRILRSGSPTLLKLPFHGSGSWLFSSVASKMPKKIFGQSKEVLRESLTGEPPRLQGSYPSTRQQCGRGGRIHLHQRQCGVQGAFISIACSVRCRVYGTHVHLHQQPCGVQGAFISITCSLECRV
jgi:hypothetical protein